MPSSDEPKIVRPSPPVVEALWSQIEPLVELAIPRACGRLQAKDVLEGCRSGIFDLWIVGVPGRHVIEAVAVAELLTFSTKRVLSLFLVSAKPLRRFLPLMAEIERRAIELECEEIQVQGSRAWRRFLPQLRERFTVLTMEVDHGQR